MKTNLLVRAALGVLTLALAPTLLVAQDAPKRPYQRPPQGTATQRPAASGSASRSPQSGEGVRAVLESMNDEQKGAYREMFETLRSTSREQTEQLMLARRALVEVSFGEKPDETAIRAKAAEVGKLEGELAVERSKVFAEHRAKFTPEQQQALKLMLALPPGMSGMNGGARPVAGTPGTTTDAANRRGPDGLYGRPGTQEEFRKPRPPEEAKP